MADIRIEEKPTGTPSWLWLLGLLLLALIAWGLYEAFDDDDDDIETMEIVDDSDDMARGSDIVSSGNTYTLIDFDDPAAGERYGDLANDYVTYTENMTGEMGLDHEFSHSALTKLANASVALAAAHGMSSELDVRDKATMIKQRADAITRDPMSTTHADDIRAAAESIAGILSAVQMKHYPGLEGAMADVMKNARDINASTLTLNQKEDVRSFFGSARVALEAMREKQPNPMM